MESLSTTLILLTTSALYIVAGASSDDSNSTASFESFVFIGKERIMKYDEFGGLPAGICTTLKTLNLQYVQFDPNALVESLRGCEELRNITLLNVEFMGLISAKVTLPNLETFELFVHQIEESSANEFMEHLFFYDPKIHYVVPSTVNINIRSRINSGNLIYHSKTCRLEVWYIYNYDLTKYFEYNELKLSLSFLDLKVLKLSNLTSLDFTSQYYENGLFQVLSSAERLVHLTVYHSWVTDKPIQKISVDLSIFPAIEKFQKLELAYANIGTTKPIMLQRLGVLTLFDSQLNTSLISISKSVYDLYLRNSTILGDNLNSFISRMDNLTNITLWYSNEYSYENFNLASLNRSSNKVENLNLIGLKLQTSVYVQFESLREVAFKLCAFEENGESSISKTFRRAIKVSIFKSSMTYGAFQGLLNTSVELFSYARNDIDIPEIGKFLLDSGVPYYILYPDLKRSNITTIGWAYVPNSDQLYNFNFRDTVLYTYVLLLLTVSAIGILGNILSGIVLTRKNMRSSTSCILLGLTFCDSVILITYACSLLYFGIKLILVFMGFSISSNYRDDKIFGTRITSALVTRLDELQYWLMYPLNKTAYTGSVYTTILLTTERYIAVCWPFSVRRILKIKTAIYSTLLVLVFAVTLNIPRWVEAHQYYSKVYEYWYPSSFVYTTSLNFERITAGSGLLRNRVYRQYYHGWIWVTVMYVIPIFGLSFLNFRIWTQLKLSKQNRDSMTCDRRNRDQDEMTSLTKMLLCVIMIFAICNSVSGATVWALIWHKGWDPADIEVFSCIPLIINSSINFVIYTLLGSKFRAELKNLISSWLRLICRVELGSRSSASQNEISLRPILTNT